MDAATITPGLQVRRPAASHAATGSAAGSCLDLFCCEGGAGMGYALAGYEVTGVDIVPRPRYPFAFVLGDALEYLEAHGHEYDLIHASPPCQGYSHLTPAKNRGDHAKLIPAVRELVKRLGKPYVIENVAGARHELENPVMLCGSMFGLRTQRHRYFETNIEVTAPRKCDHSNLPLLVTTASKASRAKRHAIGIPPKSVKNAPQAYGIGWMSSDGLKEAIPPAYTRHIGEAARRQNDKVSRPIPTPELPADVRGDCSPPSPCSAVRAQDKSVRSLPVKCKVKAGQIIVEQSVCGIVFGFPEAVWPADPAKQRAWVERLTPWWDMDAPDWSPQAHRLRESCCKAINNLTRPAPKTANRWQTGNSLPNNALAKPHEKLPQKP